MSEPSYEELKARLAQVQKTEIRKQVGELYFKVGEKGGISLYGLGRFPTTLYYAQWKKLIAIIPDLEKFMEDNKSKLKLREGD